MSIKHIPIVDEAERQQTLAFMKGFETARRNMIFNIVSAHEQGQSLKSIYKHIKLKNKEYQINANINHGR